MRPGRIVARLFGRPSRRFIALQNKSKSLRETEFRSAVELLATFIGRAADLQPWLSDAQINRDRNLRLHSERRRSIGQDLARELVAPDRRERAVALPDRRPDCVDDQRVGFPGRHAGLD